ncbi:Transforming growth factor beta-1 [Bagarius yarrelli]|uniref:Transforming growth factor beta-1 n=1 Tax=Bagarius yarrelli TaxID=175774 RepID=A0A556TWX2_BAGYA|nr:Transforming growth factor beta-1 [Bagarius yarrelli]
MMRAQDLLMALLCLMGCMGYCGTLSTCKPLNLELMKRKRIEAIRGQILSKLQLPKEPEDDDVGEGDEVPAEVLSVYNSTLELSEELMQNTEYVESTEAEEEAYYAKEVHKFNMTKIMNNTLMLFNVTAMRAVLGLERMISQAELRLLIRVPRIAPGKEERLELYQGAGDKARYLDSHFITNELNGKWISFDVTQTLKNWLQSPAPGRNGKLQGRLFVLS